MTVCPVSIHLLAGLLQALLVCLLTGTASSTVSLKSVKPW